MPAEPAARPVEVLLVEDSPGDVRLMQESLKEGKVRVNLTVAAAIITGQDFVVNGGRASRPQAVNSCCHRGTSGASIAS